MLREDILKYIENQFMGPPRGEPHELDFIKDYRPYQHLVTGMLFPQDAIIDSENYSRDSTIVDTSIDPLSLSFTYLTAVVGMSINVPESINKINIRCSACFYTEEESKTDNKDNEKEKYWKRKDIDEELLVVELKDHEINIFDDRAKIDIRVFKSGDNKLVRITMINNKSKEKRGRVNQSDILTRVSMDSWITDGKILPYPKVFRSTNDGEEEEQQILYKDEHIYGIGHACSVKWRNKKDSAENIVSLDFIPTGITKGSKSTLEEYENSKSIDMEFLANPQNEKNIVYELKKFVQPYDNWVKNIINELTKLKKNPSNSLSFVITKSHEKAIDKLINKLSKTLKRISSGVDFLEKDSTALSAFQYANKAMLMQMIHQKYYQRIIDKDRLNYKFFKRNHNFVNDFNNIDYSDLKKIFGSDYKKFEWRPFQLAYFLMTCKSTVKKDDQDRETVDLIWFSTGGGKTEAYLFVSAFLIFFNKLIDPESSGVEIIMRYTLRLLTQDQFIRTSRMIIACEKIRRDNVAILGNNEIGIGLWIGGGISPNHYESKGEKSPGSSEMLIDLKKKPNPDCESPFSIAICPWCNTNLVPEKLSGEENYGFEGDDYNFIINCPSDSCEFHEKLPIQVVDQAIYENPPTFILGTVDKFVRLAHQSQSGNILFNDDTKKSVNLIIQDELHLISGPLGTITGGIEAAIDTMLSFWGVKPKYMAATATIRGAANQIEKLYARNVEIFPPSGISHADRFFSKIDENDKGRLYVGIMSQGHTAVTTTVRIAAALSQSVEEISAPNEQLDGYHTLVVYHNSRNEKSKTKTLAAQDIPERIKQIASGNNQREKNNNMPRVFGENGIAELSSDVPDELFETRKRLDLKRGDQDVIDVLSVTNIIQVGIDIQRLALMQVTGQPKTSAEFIQATSRVGRGDNKGLVIVNYIATNPRDRSHYEQFNGYINSVNRFIEPTSVTPSAEPALRRTMPTCLVMLSKHILGLGQNSDAINFKYTDNNLAIQLFDNFKDRLLKSDPSEKINIEKYFKRYINEWEDLVSKNTRVNYHAKFSKSAKDVKFLTKDYGDTKNEALWDILSSMRNVDSEVGITIE